MSFKWLVRYTSATDGASFGDLKKEPGNGSLEGAEVEVLEGDLDKGLSRTGKTDKIQKVAVKSLPWRGNNNRHLIAAMSSTQSASVRVHWTELSTACDRGECM